MKQMVPNKTQMRRYLRQKLTQQQIVEAWEQESGVRVSRSAIAMAISRYGLKAANSQPRYTETLPWRVQSHHQMSYNARMLRLEGKRLRGDKLTPQESRWLEAFRRTLQERNAVVTYIPDDPEGEGFVWVQRNQYDDPDSLIRVEIDNRPKGRKSRAV